MELHTPSYVPKFHCLAGDCPHTCCAWWQVPVDEPTLRRLETLPGPLGERARRALTTDGEGSPCLALTGGYCPLLTEEGLCALQLQEGEGALPAICRQHPRFSYDYGPVREEGLCASCPEAARLILAEDFTLTVTQFPGEGTEEADELLFPMLKARQVALDMLRGGEPLSQRLQALLLFGNEVQNALDGGDMGALEEVFDLYSEGYPLLEGVKLPPRGAVLAQMLEVLAGLEALQPQWRDLLSAGKARLAAGEILPAPGEAENPQTAGDGLPTLGGVKNPQTLGEEQVRRAAEYFLYRHWLRCLNDGDVLTWCELAVAGVAVCAALAEVDGLGFAEVLRRFCLEVEHSQPNLDALQDALWHQFTLPELLALAGE